MLSKTHLVHCSNCAILMEDSNPSNESYSFTTEDLKQIEEPIYLMLSIKDKDHSYWGCLGCKTDSYLQDMTSRELCDVKETTNSYFPSV